MNRANVKKLRKKVAIARDAKERRDADSSLPWYAGPVNWLFAKLPTRVRMELLRIKMILHRASVNPAFDPRELGAIGRYKSRSVEIELGFIIHGDGQVVYRNRWGNDEIVSDEHMIAAVHTEYRNLVEEGRKQFASGMS